MHRNTNLHSQTGGVPSHVPPSKHVRLTRPPIGL